MANLAPEVTVFEKNLVLNSFLSGSEFFTSSDPDGDAITRVRVFDFNDVSTSGHWEFNGQPRPNGSVFELNFSDLNKLFYIAGSAIGSEFLRIQTYDGSLWSSPENVAVARTVSPTNDIRPVPTGQDVTVLGNESEIAGTFISADDPDGYKITRYYLKDVFKNGSQFKLGNKYLEEGKYHYVNADDMQKLRFVGKGTGGSDQALYFAYDGNRWSPRGTVQITIDPNLNKPVGQFNSVLVPFGDEVRVWENVLWFDADMSTAKSLFVFDRTSQTWSGQLHLNGVPLAAKTWHEIPSSQFNNLSFVGGSRALKEQVLFQVFDGRFRSASETLEFNTVPRPELASERSILISHRESIPLFDVFDQLDSGPAPVAYELIDTNPDLSSGYVTLNNIKQNPNQVHSFTSSQMRNQVGFDSGGFLRRRTDPIYARTYNGATFSKWTRVDLRTEPNYDKALISELSPGNPNDWSDWHEPVETPPQFPVTKHRLTYSFWSLEPTEVERGEADGNWGCNGIDTSGDGVLDTADGDGIFKLPQRLKVREALDYVSELVNIEFVEVPESFIDPETGVAGGILRYGNYWLPFPESTAGAFAFFPADKIAAEQGGDMWYNNANGMSCENWDRGTFSYFVHLHELGHALGEPHSFDAPNPLPPSANGGTDNVNFSTMSYTDRDDGIRPHTYSIYDILNFQNLYGANTTSNTGDDYYDITRLAVNGRSTFSASIWDNGGTDTISAEGSSGDAVVNLNEFEFSSIGGSGGDVPIDNVGITFGTKIENAVGGFFNDALTGNYMDNVMNGGNGHDVLKGLGGNDTMTGGPGNDRFIWGIADGSDVIDEALGAGRDTIEITSFPGLDFQTGIKAWREDLDLVLSLNPSGEPSQGTLKIENQAYGRYRVESLEIGALRIDVTSIYNQTTSFAQSFRAIASSSAFGSLVVPV